MTEIKGWHVLTTFICAFGVIITVNMILATNAVRTFPGLVVDNAYVASQNYDRARAAQLALGWEVSAWTESGELHLKVTKDGQPIAPVIEQAILARATTTAQDHKPALTFTGSTFVAPVTVTDGNWNLLLKARSAEGTLFEQRVIVEIRS